MIFNNAQYLKNLLNGVVHMTTDQKRKILIRIQEIEKSELKEVRAQLLANPYQSASISSGGGSKSYTVADSAKLSEAISELTEELKQLRALLSNDGASPFRIGQIYTVYC